MSVDQRLKAIEAFAKNETVKPVDFSIFKRFEFVGDVGDYATKQVCIMSALRLATEIALGHTTLEAAIMSDADWETEEKFRKENPGIVVNPEATDKVMCVSDVIRTIAICRNDATVGNKNRKDWAIATMPKLLSTYLGKGFEAKLRSLEKKFDADLRPWLTNYRTYLQSELSTLKPRSKRAVQFRLYLREIEPALARNGKIEEHDIVCNDFDLVVLDAKLDYLCEAARVERELRAAKRQ